MRRNSVHICAAAALLLGAGSALQAQQDYGLRLGDRVGERVIYRAGGVANYMGAMDPTIQRWYLPSVHFSERGRQQWEYTNWAAQRQRRYVDVALEGNYYYDFFGERITQGWVVYDWRQTQPVISEGSRVAKASRYSRWFNRLVLSTDISGGRGSSIMVGDEIAMTLTPMTFRKAGFNGLVTEYTEDRFRATGLFSRISQPILSEGAGFFQHWTNLVAGRATADVTDFLTLGVTFVNSHHGTGSSEAFPGDSFQGALNAEQLSERLDLLVLRLADDSPEDNEGGAILFSSDIEISTTLARETTEDGEVVLVKVDTLISANDIGFRPLIEGGKRQQGFLTADGPEEIVMKYYLGPEEGQDETGTLRASLQQQLGLTLDEAENALSAIRNVRFRLVLGNDYRVEMSSDRQTDRFGVPQFRLVTRADRNIKNQLNQQEVVFDYGIPTANQIIGLTTEISDFHGVDFYGEVNVNTEYRKYPAIGRSRHKALSGIEGDRNSLGWMANLSWRKGPWSLFAEGFGMEDGYSTSIKPLRQRGTTDYSPEATNLLYDYVDDNDDHDRHPDQLRVGEGSLIPQSFQRAPTVKAQGVADPEVFPGYDENGDFISDFNQNNIFDRRNFFPDYDEPFLRYRSDRPEFLFGIDLNNNGWVDRFENDNEPDYPYNKDHWGHNIYGSAEITPASRFRVGQLRQERKKSASENTTTYAIVTFDNDWASWGRVRAFDMLKRAEDDIPDHLVQWVIPRTEFGSASESSGRLEAVEDPLAAADTWINTLYGDWNYESRRGWSTFHRFKWETWRQQDTDVEFLLDDSGARTLDDEGNPVVLFDPLGPEGRNGREQSGVFGVINKVDYVLYLGSLRVDPRYKSEFLRETPFSLDLTKRRSWDSIFFLRLSFPALRSTVLQAGLEQRFFFNLKGDERDIDAGERTGDLHGSALALQLTTRSKYLGYNMTTQLGIRIDRRSLEIADEKRESETSGLSFVSIFAGL